MVDKVLPSPILPQVSPRTLDGVISTSQTTTRQLLDVIREHARAINQMADYLNALDSAWLSYAPTVGAFSGSFTTLGTIVGRYKNIGANTVLVYVDISITTNGTAAGGVTFTLPLTPGRTAIGCGREVAVTGSILSVAASTAGPANITTYNNAYPGGDGRQIIASVIYPLSA